MAVNFKVGINIDPSGFPLAVVDVPDLDPEKNISLIDNSYRWEENVANTEAGTMESHVDSGGHLPKMTIMDFLVTNITTTSTNDIDAVPLYYQHTCRFYHYSYGENPEKHIYITDQYGNILKGLNFKAKATRVIQNVYKVEMLTDFHGTEYVTYKVKYNRCTGTGTNIYPGWEENFNAEPFFTEGNPLIHKRQYSVYGPDENGLYSAIVPPTPNLSRLINSTGMSFERAPTIIDQDVNNVSEYSAGVTVVLTLKATGTATFSVKRSHTREGVVANDYLTSTTTDSWGAETNFSLGTEITGIPGISLTVNDDYYLTANDEAYFSASRAYYYLKPISYKSIYLSKPKNVTREDDWYLRVKNGRFRRRMNESGEVVPSGEGILWEYTVPEYCNQFFDIDYGPPYMEQVNERAEILDRETIQLEKSPLYIPPSAVLEREESPGFPPSSYISVWINDTQISENSIIDWDKNNGTVRLAQILDRGDNVVSTYKYKQEFYEYTGFFGSGGLYAETAPFPFFDLDLNPTPSHSYEIYASGIIYHVFLRPYLNVDDNVIVISEGLYHNDTGTPSGIYDFNLGSVSLGPSSRVSDVEVIDVRRRGGGLSKRGQEEIADVIDVQPESQFFWDVGYFDGQAVPANGVLVVEVPKTILSSNGGPFDEGEVRKRILKHMALGEFPVIRYI